MEEIKPKIIKSKFDLEKLMPGERVEVLIPSAGWFGDRTVYKGKKKTTSLRLEFVRQDLMNKSQIEYVVIDPSEGKEVDNCYVLTNHKLFKIIREHDKKYRDYVELLKKKGQWEDF